MVKTNQRVESEEKLMEMLERDVSGTDKRSIVFMAGHFPLILEEVQRTAEADFQQRWGPFPL